MFAMAEHLAAEENAPEISRKLIQAGGAHYNSYENYLSESSIRDAIALVEEYAAVLDRVRASPPRPFVVSTDDDVRRLRYLVGQDFAKGVRSEVGFTQSTPFQERRLGQGPDEGDASGEMAG